MMENKSMTLGQTMQKMVDELDLQITLFPVGSLVRNNLFDAQLSLRMAWNALEMERSLRNDQ